jgi:hypothetical protein
VQICGQALNDFGAPAGPALAIEDIAADVPIEED